jgi:hypothetical protein
MLIFGTLPYENIKINFDFRRLNEISMFFLLYIYALNDAIFSAYATFIIYEYLPISFLQNKNLFPFHKPIVPIF